MTALAPGSLCVCVYPGPWCFDPGNSEAAPIKGTVYTVRDARVITGIPVIRLVEIVNPPAAPPFQKDECWFQARCFRPLDSSRIATLLKLTAPVPEHVDA